MTYDNWKTTDPNDQWLGPEPPPCERWDYGPGRMHLHPRYPSGDCRVCGAMATESCKWASAEEWEVFQTGG